VNIHSKGPMEVSRTIFT